MTVAARSNEMSPMMEMNTTPLIDVMLVLLIMFIITVPAATHSVEVNLPQGPPPDIFVHPTKNKIVITAGGAILWNGAPLGRMQLRQALAATQRMRPQPELHVQPEANARYQLVDQVLADTKIAQVTQMGFVGNEQYSRF